ncbi:LuxR C-terminal-related transcriptional regulator [Frigoribacterium sp. RIT-PI-h]|uniref:LuxR C-terminal-related transcriptional regulator n=1 Tax=Frigoribacterium sp. RIT-PI-h TaxID=1690245 RepID=UPI0035161665
MTRGARVAHELGSCWAESWLNATSGVDRHLKAAARVSVSCNADVAEAPIELVTTDTELDEAEQRMLTLTAYGLSNAEIAQATSYSRQAVGWHLGKLMRAWKAPNRTEPHLSQSLLSRASSSPKSPSRRRRKPYRPRRRRHRHRHPVRKGERGWRTTSFSSPLLRGVPVRPGRRSPRRRRPRPAPSRYSHRARCG